MALSLELEPSNSSAFESDLLESDFFSELDEPESLEPPSDAAFAFEPDFA